MARGFVTLQQVRVVLKALPDEEIIMFNKMAEPELQAAVGTSHIQEDALQAKIKAYLQKYSHFNPQRFSSQNVDPDDPNQKHWMMVGEEPPPAYKWLLEEYDRKWKAAQVIQKHWRAWNKRCKRDGRPPWCMERDLRRARADLRAAYARATLNNKHLRRMDKDLFNKELMVKYKSLQMAERLIRKIEFRDKVRAGILPADAVPPDVLEQQRAEQQAQEEEEDQGPDRVKSDLQELRSCVIEFEAELCGRRANDSGCDSEQYHDDDDSCQSPAPDSTPSRVRRRTSEALQPAQSNNQIVGRHSYSGALDTVKALSRTSSRLSHSGIPESRSKDGYATPDEQQCKGAAVSRHRPRDLPALPTRTWTTSYDAAHLELSHPGPIITQLPTAHRVPRPPHRSKSSCSPHTSQSGVGLPAPGQTTEDEDDDFWPAVPSAEFRAKTAPRNEGMDLASKGLRSIAVAPFKAAPSVPVISTPGSKVHSKLCSGSQSPLYQVLQPQGPTPIFGNTTGALSVPLSGLTGPPRHPLAPMVPPRMSMDIRALSLDAYSPDAVNSPTTLIAGTSGTATKGPSHPAAQVCSTSALDLGRPTSLAGTPIASGANTPVKHRTSWSSLPLIKTATQLNAAASGTSTPNGTPKAAALSLEQAYEMSMTHQAHINAPRLHPKRFPNQPRHLCQPLMASSCPNSPLKALPQGQQVLAQAAKLQLATFGAAEPGPLTRRKSSTNPSPRSTSASLSGLPTDSAAPAVDAMLRLMNTQRQLRGTADNTLNVPSNLPPLPHARVKAG